jgi:hypothetical protein
VFSRRGDALAEIPQKAKKKPRQLGHLGAVRAPESNHHGRPNPRCSGSVMPHRIGNAQDWQRENVVFGKAVVARVRRVTTR